jgi:hypothetical protein
MLVPTDQETGYPIIGLESLSHETVLLIATFDEVDGIRIPTMILMLIVSDRVLRDIMSLLP